MRISDWSSDVCSSDLQPRLDSPGNSTKGCATAGSHWGRLIYIEPQLADEEVVDHLANWPRGDMVDRKLVELMAVSLDASLRTDRWEELLDKLVDYLGLISGVIIVSDPRHERRVTPFQSRFIREDARDMLQRFLAREDADDAPAYRAIQNLPLNRLYAEPEIFGCEGWENLPASAFRDFQRNVFGINYRFAMPLNNFVSCADILTLHSASDLGGERRQQVGDLELIAPMFGKALRLHRIFSALQAQFSAMLLALDRLRLGTVLMLEDCTVIHSNETARTILHARDGLRLDMAQRLEASDSRASQWLREVVSEVSQTAALNGLTADRACAIGRPSGKADYLITVGPLVDSVGELEHGLRSEEHTSALQSL